MSLPFMSGRAFSSTMLDSLLCSAHSNPILLSIVRMLLFSGCDDDDDDNAEVKPDGNIGGQSADTGFTDGRPAARTPSLYATHSQSSRPGSQPDLLTGDDHGGGGDRDSPSGVFPQRAVDPQTLFDDSPIYREQCFHSLPKVHLNLKNANEIVQEPVPSHLVGTYLLVQSPSN